MDEATSNTHLPYQPLENPAYILPDFIVKEELLDVKDHPPHTFNMGNPKEILPSLGIKQELQIVEDKPDQAVELVNPKEIQPILSVKQELLKVEDTLDEIISVNHWKLDNEEVKVESKDVITFEDHTLELRTEISDCSLFDLINAPHDVSLQDDEGKRNTDVWKLFSKCYSFFELFVLSVDLITTQHHLTWGCIFYCM